MSRVEMSFDRFATLLAYGAALFVACLSPAQNDTFWHLRAGRDIWRSGQIPRADHYSYTAAGRPWPDHEWLWQAVAYALDRVGGLALLTAMIAACAIVALVLVLRLAPPSTWVAAVALIAAVPGLHTEWSLRPQVTSMLFFAVALTVVSRERYLLLPFVFALWANVHAGVASGGVLLVAATALAAADHLVGRTRSTKDRLVRMVATTVASGLATLANPLGIGLWQYVLGARTNPTHAGNPDWASGFVLGPVQILFWIWFLTTLIVLVWRRRRFQSWQQRVLVAVALATAPLAMVGIRNIGFFLLAALPVVIYGLTPVRSSRAHVPLAHPLLVTTAALGAFAVAAMWWSQPARLNWKPMSPVIAAAVRECPTPIYNTYAAGGYLLWFTPQVKVFIDSRADPYSASFVERDRILELTGRYRPTFLKYRIKCAVVRPGSTIASALTADGWRPRRTDSQWSILIKPGDRRAETNPVRGAA